MNEPLVPHGFYDGPVKELAARHLALIKAVFILLLITLPVIFVGSLCNNDAYVRYETKSYTSFPGVVTSSTVWGPIAPEGAKIIDYQYAGYTMGRESFEMLKVAVPLLVLAVALHGVGLLLFRFFRLAKLLYPHLTFYFTAMVLVPFLNVVVIILLLRSALHQMRQMGLRVGIFGIDPARFA